MRVESWRDAMVRGFRQRLGRQALLAAERRFTQALARPQPVQAELLARILRHQAATSYGQDHHFASLRGVRDFQRRVPVVDAAALAPYLAQVRAGTAAVLSVDGPPPLPQARAAAGAGPAARAAPATAAAGGAAAWQAAVAPWWGSVLRAMPALLNRPVAVLPELAPLAGAALARLPGGCVAMPTPPASAGWAGACRLRAETLVAARDLGAIWVGHAGQLAGLVAALGELGAAADGGALALWPELELVVCADPDEVAAQPALRTFLAGVAVAPAPLAAAEAVLTAPLWRPEAPTPMAVTSHFFEFLPLEGRGGGPARGLPLLPHDLATGGLYLPVVTTGQGLYRFQLSQAVVCRGHLGETPLLQPAGLTRPRQPLGEGSVAEYEVRAMWRATAAELALPHDFALCTFRVAPTVGLRLFLETTADDQAVEALAAAWEARFAAHLAYRLGARAPAQQPIDVVRVAGGWRAWGEAMHSQGRDPWNVPARALDADAPWAMVFADQMA